MASTPSASIAPAARSLSNPRNARLLTSITRGAIVSLLAAGSAIAQTAPPTTTDTSDVYSDHVTVTGTGQEERVVELPLPISVLTRSEIDNTQEDSVEDLLRRVPGVQVMRNGDEGSSASLFVRGTESEHVLSLFDGVRLNSPYFAGYDWSIQPSAGLERVEVARGPYSALWGADAVGGVVNVIPGRGAEELHFQLFGEGGSDDWQRLQGTVGWSDRRFDVYATAFDRQGRGEPPNSDFANRQLLADGGFSWSDGNRIALLVQDLDAEVGVPFSDPLTPTPNRRNESAQLLAALPLSLQPTTGWTLELTPSLVERELYFRDPDDPSGFTRSETFADTTQVRLVNQHALSAPGSSGASHHELGWGGEWREDRVDSGSSFGVDLDGETARLYGVFVQDVWRPTERLNVIAGLRYDDAESWGSELSPRLALGYQLTPLVALRASYGEAFRQPSIGELHFPFSGNPDLVPEHSRSAELGISLVPGRSRIDAYLFTTDTEDLIDFDFVSFSFANVDRAEIRGAELAWVVPFFRARSSLQGTWLDTEDQDGLALLRRPEWSASWTLDGPVTERLSGDLGLYWVGSRADVDAVTFARKELGSHLIASLALAFEVVDRLEVTARIQNLADEQYEEVDGYPAPGRRFMIGLRWGR